MDTSRRNYGNKGIMKTRERKEEKKDKKKKEKNKRKRKQKKSFKIKFALIRENFLLIF